MRKFVSILGDIFIIAALLVLGIWIFNATKKVFRRDAKPVAVATTAITPNLPLTLMASTPTKKHKSHIKPRVARVDTTFAGDQPKVDTTVAGNQPRVDTTFAKATLAKPKLRRSCCCCLISPTFGVYGGINTSPGVTFGVAADMIRVWKFDVGVNAGMRKTDNVDVGLHTTFNVTRHIGVLLGRTWLLSRYGANNPKWMVGVSVKLIGD